MALADTSSAVDLTGGDARVEDYVALLKPRVMSLVVFTALVGLLIAPGTLHPLMAFTAILAIAVGAGASGALNMWFDADIDAVMSRTASRPIPRGRISREEALGFGLVLSVFSVSTLALAVHWLAAGLLAFTIFFYAVVYTMWLKRSTPQNIVIGGAAGAFPPVIAWAAATGSVSIEAWVLFAIIFLWTPPHFWALALYKRADYEAAGVPMLPNVAGDDTSRRQILVYSILLAISALAPIALGMSGWAYGSIAAVLGAAMVALAALLNSADEGAMRRQARRLFSFSMLYLFAIFAALLVDHYLPAAFGGMA